MSEEQKRQVERIERKKQLQKAAYAEIKDSEALRDLFDWLRDQERSNTKLAEAEMDSLTKRSLYLQNAIAYGKVRLYLDEKLDTPAIKI